MKSASSFALAACLLLAIAGGCSGPSARLLAAREDFFVADLQEFATGGFLFMPGAFPGDFDPIALLTLEVWPEARWQMSKQGLAGEGHWELTALDVQSAVRQLHEKAKAMGADAIVHFRVEPIHRDIPGATGLQMTGVSVSGYAILRLPGA